MPDITKRKALEEPERNRQPAKLSELVKAVNVTFKAGHRYNQYQ